jgi:hypothetical protein
VAARFRAASPMPALVGTAGSLLATVQLSLAEPDFADDTICDQLAEHLLRMLDLPAEEA